MPTVLVSVPKLGKRCFRTVGVFIAEKGIINVDIPPGLWFGDEFEVTYALNENQEKQKFIRVPLPMNLQPGHCFRHRAPNGKSVLVSCPPGVKQDCDLLIPWSDSSNDHFPVQAQIAPPEPVKPKPKPVQTQPQRNPIPHGNRSNNSHRNADGFNVNDLELARALSLTTLNIQPVADDAAALERAIQASMQEAQKEREKYLSMQSSAYSTNHKSVQPQVSTKSEADDDIALRLALEASLKEAESQAAMLRKQFTVPSPGSTPNQNRITTTSTSPVDDYVDEEEIMFSKAKSLSSSQNRSPLKAAPFANVTNSYATGPVSSYSTSEGMIMEPYAFTKADPSKMQRNGS